MRIPCPVLRKGPDNSCTYVGELMATSEDTMGTVANTARGLASAYYGNQWGLEVKLYQPLPLWDTIIRYDRGGGLLKVVLKHLGCEVLEEGSVRVLFEDPAVGASRTLRSYTLVAVVTWFPAEFIVYERPDKKDSPKPVMMGQVNGLPGEIAELTQNRVREATEKHLEAEGRTILGIDVYETECAGPYIEKNQKEVRSTRREHLTLLTLAGGKFLAPSGKGCLLVELKTETYIPFDYVVFREEAGQSYTLAGSGTAKGLPSQTLMVIQNGARRFIEEDLGGWDAEAMRAHISVYEPRGEHYDRPRQWLENLQLTAGRLANDFVQRSMDVELSQVPRVLLITFLRVHASQHDNGMGEWCLPPSSPI